jgi:hypothetical protein
MKIAGIANARCASVTHQTETLHVEIFVQATAKKIKTKKVSDVKLKMTRQPPRGQFTTAQPLAKLQHS